MKNYLLPALCLVLVSGALVYAESGERILRPKYSAEISSADPSEWYRARLDVLLATPLGREDLFDKRFSAFGPQIFLTLPLKQLGPGMSLFFQSGLSLSVSRLTLTPTLTFTHMFIDIPAILQLLFPMGRENALAAEIFAGGYFRALEYDSRDTPDGGLHGVRNTSRIVPEIGAGIYYRISASTFLRLRAGYARLGAGLSFDF